MTTQPEGAVQKMDVHDAEARARGAAARAKITIDKKLGQVTAPWVVELATQYEEALGLTLSAERPPVRMVGKRATSRYRALLSRLSR